MQPVSEELAQPASSSYFFCPDGNPGIENPPIATETARFAALQAAHGNDFIQIRGKRLELFAQMEVLQQTLSDGNAELNTFDAAGSAVRLVAHHETLQFEERLRWVEEGEPPPSTTFV